MVALDWISGMQRREVLLKDLVDMLAAARGEGLLARSERASLRMLLHARLASMRAALEQLERSTPEAEQAILRYQIRVLLPLYSHLSAVVPLLDRGCLSAV